MSVDATLASLRVKPRIQESAFFLFMTVLLLATAAVGFAPNSIAILSGARPSPPLIIHIHAACMATWLLLSVTQTLLSAAGHKRFHSLSIIRGSWECCILF